jgi:hypothetical protein
MGGIIRMENNEKKFDIVQKPLHYNFGKIECIDALLAMASGMVGEAAYLTSTIVKYLWRWAWKENPLQDLKKARFYLDKLIATVEEDEKKDWRNKDAI